MARSDSTLSTTEEYWPTMYDEWLSWSGEETRSEWVDGEVVVFMPPSIRHARLAHFRLGLLDPVVLYFGLGEVFVEPVEMRLRAGRSFRLPDILFVAREHLHRLSAMRLEGPVDLVVKLLSEESQQRERIEKMAEYAEGGIPENWAIDAWSDSQYAAFYQLGPDRRYRPCHSTVLVDIMPRCSLNSGLAQTGCGETHCRNRWTAWPKSSPRCSSDGRWAIRREKSMSVARRSEANVAVTTRSQDWTR